MSALYLLPICVQRDRGSYSRQKRCRANGAIEHGALRRALADCASLVTRRCTTPRDPQLRPRHQERSPPSHGGSWGRQSSCGSYFSLHCDDVTAASTLNRMTRPDKRAGGTRPALIMQWDRQRRIRCPSVSRVLHDRTHRAVVEYSNVDPQATSQGPAALCCFHRNTCCPGGVTPQCRESMWLRAVRAVLPHVSPGGCQLHTCISMMWPVCGVTLGPCPQQVP
jgi:hypothetical protein